MRGLGRFHQLVSPFSLVYKQPLPKSSKDLGENSLEFVLDCLEGCTNPYLQSQIHSLIFFSKSASCEKIAVYHRNAHTLPTAIVVVELDSFQLAPTSGNTLV